MPDHGEPVPLLRSQLNLWLGRTMVFALSPGEGSSTALMVVVRCRTPRRRGRAQRRPRHAAPARRRLMQFLCRLGTPEGAVIEQVHHGSDAERPAPGPAAQGLPRLRGAAAAGAGGWRCRGGGRRGKLSTQRFLVFNQELAALLAAGLPLLQCLELMLERMRDPLFREVLTDVRERVASGQELSAAFEAHGELFPRLYPSSLKAGERSGDLEKVIRRFVRYLQLVLEARKRVVSALVYPTVLVCLSVAMIVIMTVFVVPKFAGLYADLEAELPLITRVTLAIGQFVQEHWIVIVLRHRRRRSGGCGAGARPPSGRVGARPAAPAAAGARAGVPPLRHLRADALARHPARRRPAARALAGDRHRRGGQRLAARAARADRAAGARGQGAARRARADRRASRTSPSTW